MDRECNNLLLVGVDNSSLAHSAKNAGYKAFTADYFGDLDVRSVSDGFMSVIEQKPCVSSGRFEKNYSPEVLYSIVESLHKRARKFEGTLLSSGLDDSFKILDKINDRCKIIGNSPETIKAIRDKKFLPETENNEGISPRNINHR